MGYSRLVVKNLPNSTNEVKLKDLFSSKGTVTDVQLKKFSDGKTRHFAFIGFKSEEEAETALKYFDNSFIGASKIRVEYCYNLNDANRPRSWSKHTKEKEKATTAAASKKRKGAPDNSTGDEGEHRKMREPRPEDAIMEKAEEDPGFLEFLSLHDKKGAKWGNDSIVDAIAAKMESKKLKKISKDDSSSGDSEDSDDDKPEKDKTDVLPGKPKKEKRPEDTYFTLKMRDLPKKAKKKDIKAFFAPLKPKSIRMPRGVRGFAYVGFSTETEGKKALQKHRSILLGNQISVIRYIPDEVGGPGANLPSMRHSSKWEEQTKEVLERAETISESGRIFIRNLSYTLTEEELKGAFDKFGPITETHLPVDRITRQNKGFGFVTFMLPEHAQRAYEELDGTTLQGRMLHLLPSLAKEDDDNPSAAERDAGSSFKREKEKKKKENAGKGGNWNSLFLGQNAVAEVAAKKYGLSRKELLLAENDNDADDKGLSSIGVRMALAETEVVSETKKFLEANGVSLQAFEEKVDKRTGKRIKAERSTTALLVKNLPVETSEDALRTLFEKHGPIARVVLPPHGLTAIVEYMIPSEARNGFKKLAYTNFHGMPLYLEWAPIGVFGGADRPSPAASADLRKEEGVKDKEVPSSNETLQEPSQPKLPDYSRDKYDDGEEELTVPEPETTIFIKNLNFSTNEDDIKKHFSGMGRVFACTVARKKDPKRPDAQLSQGFGFLQFYRARDTKEALSSLQSSMLQNHTLELKPSSRTLLSESADTENKKKEKKEETKILVRNVPFQASEEEVTDLFKVFGKLKAVRMPKKAVSSGEGHRGFCFIDFFSSSCAQTAFDTLSKSTHLYGRRLVLEWAEKEESLQGLREKAGKQLRRTTSGDMATSMSASSTKKGMKRYFEDGSKNKGKGKSDDEDEGED